MEQGLEISLQVSEARNWQAYHQGKIIQLQNDDLSQRDQIKLLLIETASQKDEIESLKAETNQLREDNASQKAQNEKLRSSVSTQSAQMALVIEQLEQIKSKVYKD